MSILYIDDDPEDIDILHEAVKTVDPSIEYTSFTRCSEALAYLRDQDTIPDHIIIDINMPGMAGPECLQQLRSETKFKKTRIVIYSTNSSPQDVEYIESMGATFTKKPSSFSDLCLFVRKLADVS